MPTYDFVCSECGADGEEFFSMSKAPGIGGPSDELTCPEECKSGEMLRVMSAPAFMVKEGEPIFEQVYKENADGSMDVMPAARSLRRGNTRTIPKTSPMPRPS